MRTNSKTKWFRHGPLRTVFCPECSLPGPWLSHAHSRAQAATGQSRSSWLAAPTWVVEFPYLSSFQLRRTELFLCPTRLRSNLWDALEPYPDPWRGHSSTGTPAKQEAGDRWGRGWTGGRCWLVRGRLPAACLLGLLPQGPWP